MSEYIPNSTNVKILGRTIQLDEGVLLYNSGSGIEFEFAGDKLAVTFLGDSSTEGSDDYVDYNNQARVLVLIDGHTYLDTVIKQKRECYQLLPRDNCQPKDVHVVRIIKLSEAMMSGVCIGTIYTDDDAFVKPTEYKKTLIEFIGDSITCGYGIDTKDEFDVFSTSNENASKSYAYITCDTLDVDYSMVAYSGHGIISGYTSNPEQPSLDGLLPPYYRLTAKSFNCFNGIFSQDYPWDFSRTPDIVVINLGTNDSSYTQKDAEKTAKFENEYYRFLTIVRSCNENAHIVCILGLMDDTLCPALERVVKRFEENFDNNISYFGLSVQNTAIDGIACDYHPSAISHKKAASYLADELRKYI